MSDDVQTSIDNAVKGNDVLLFMKGTPTFPQCGFSSVVVQVLDYLGVEYQAVNVLDNQDIREGIKTYSDWPTIPQLYVKGEFVGGCDIIKEMFEAGELKEYLDYIGIELDAAFCGGTSNLVRFFRSRAKLIIRPSVSSWRAISF